PFRKPAANARHGRQAALVHAHELASQSDAERFGIGGLPLIRTPELRPELDSGIPEIAVEEQQAWAKLDFGKAKVGLQQRAAWVDVEMSAATQGSRFLPPGEPASGGDKGHLAVPSAKKRPRQPIDPRLAVVAIGGGCDQQVAPRGEFVGKRLKPKYLGGLDLYGAPSHAPTTPYG